uniref:Capsid protein n=1 Tax=Genomoviridae sp. TaxID=2202565 RepID=A0A858NG54_9VIRU|nr:MAG: capsid protein [Genomoviridae sp.]
MPRAHFRKRRRTVVVRSARKSAFTRHLKRRFAKRVRQVILRNNEPKQKRIITGDGTTLFEGDGTFRTIQVFAPLQNLVQGTKKDQFVGDEIWVKGFGIHGQISNAITSDSFRVRWTLVWHRLQNNFTGVGVQYNSTTTDTTNPTATAPLSNPAFFDVNSALKFTGDGYVERFDSDNQLKVLASKDIVVNPGGNTTALKKFKFFFPVRAKYHYQDSGEDLALTTAPNYGKWGGYYIVRQVIALANSVNVQVVGTMDYQVIAYFRDP